MRDGLSKRAVEIMTHDEIAELGAIVITKIT